MRFRLLPYEVEVTAEDSRLASAIAYLCNSAVQDVPLERRLHFRVEGVGPYEIVEEGQPVETHPSADDVLNALYGRCYGRLASRLRKEGWLPLHGGLVTVAGRRLLVVGHKGVGKTTLMLRLLLDGHRVEGDEMVFTRAGSAMPLPRSFHLKPGTEALVPELAGRLEELPSTSAGDGSRVTAFDPGVAGFDWRLAVGPVDGAIVLRADHDAEGSIRTISNLELVGHGVNHSFPQSEARAPLLRACAALLGEIDGAELTVGPLHMAASHVVEFATLMPS